MNLYKGEDILRFQQDEKIRSDPFKSVFKTVLISIKNASGLTMMVGFSFNILNTVLN